jgi:hypothetical protein
MSERNTRPSAGQRLHLLNSSQIQKKIEQSALVRNETRGNRPASESIRMIYMTLLSRPPTAEEISVVEQYAREGRLSRRDTAMDLVWALINTTEFLYRH